MEDHERSYYEKKLEKFEKIYKECSEYTLDDFDLESAIVVEPSKKLKKDYPLFFYFN